MFELDGNNNIVTEYVHGPGFDEPIAMIRNNQTYYYHADGLGSIIAITNSTGAVVQRYEYNSFGEITYVQDSNFVQPYTYTAREYDSESGLYYYRARYYDAKVGRFLQKDPFRGFLKHPQTQHRYIYVGNRPTNFSDPYGLSQNNGQEGKGQEGTGESGMWISTGAKVGLTVVIGYGAIVGSPLIIAGGVIGEVVIISYEAYQAYKEGKEAIEKHKKQLEELNELEKPDI